MTTVIENYCSGYRTTSASGSGDSGPRGGGRNGCCGTYKATGRWKSNSACDRGERSGYCSQRKSAPLAEIKYNQPKQGAIDRPQTLLFCNDAVPFPADERVVCGSDSASSYLSSYISPNQALAGPPNPRTNIPPVVIPPAYDLSFWKANDFVTQTAINEETQDEEYLSGYAVSTCCGNIEGKAVVPQPGQMLTTVVSGYPRRCNVCSGKGCVVCKGTDSRPDTGMGGDDEKEDFTVPKPVTAIPTIPGLNVEPIENFTVPKPATAIPTIPGLEERGRREGGEGGEGGEVIENYSYPYLRTGDGSWSDAKPNEPGWVNTMCGYNPQQIQGSNLPSNLAVGPCEQQPEFRDYNRNLFTQTIQPGVYTTSNVNEPLNSNIGISFTQQFEPVTCKRDDSGLHYTEHDPRVLEPAEYEPNISTLTPAVPSNVYDPRFNGYGTSYRSYNEDVTGQTRFYYDDINAIRMPNYITRSKIDHLPYADSYGPMKSDQPGGNCNTSMIRGLAQDSWMRDSLQFRNDMMERLMRKRNQEMWRVRKFPKHTMSCKR